VGKILIKKLSALGLECYYWSRKSRDKGYNFCTVEELLSISDFVYLCVYDGYQMKNLIDNRRLSLMKQNAFLISGFGSQPNLKSDVIDWGEAIKMTQEHRLGGVAIEGGEKESIPIFPDHNILITPGHSGWFTKESFKRQTIEWINCIESILCGKPVNVLNRNEISEGH
jgi:phosphoglycerate dehydrogenase-like enzyme